MQENFNLTGKNVLTRRTKFPIFVKNAKMKAVKKPGKPEKTVTGSDYAIRQDDRMMVAEEAAAGISATAVQDIMGFTSLSKEFLADMLNISTKTLSRYLVSKKKLNPSGSELLLKLKQVYRKGDEIFENPGAFQAWIDTPSPGLHFRVPKSLLQTATGIDLVMEELLRIEYGYPV
jgi:putative toxin-antitoxin system antitoxin component (TIGR02293 family)